MVNPLNTNPTATCSQRTSSFHTRGLTTASKSTFEEQPARGHDLVPVHLGGFVHPSPNRGCSRPPRTFGHLQPRLPGPFLLRRPVLGR